MKIKTFEKRMYGDSKKTNYHKLDKEKLISLLKMRDSIIKLFNDQGGEKNKTITELELENRDLRNELATYSDGNNTCRPSTPIEIKQRKEISDLYQEVKRLRRITDFFLTASEVVPHDKQRDFFIQSLTKKQ